MTVYFTNIIDGNTCIGNSLSTLNIALTSLDSNLSALSAYTLNSVHFLSSTIQSVSANLQTEINFLSTSMQTVSGSLQTEINYISSHYISNYFQQTTLFQQSNGQINWNFNNGINAKVTLTANGFLNNPTNIAFAGVEGNLVVQLSTTSGISITGFGPLWNFNNYTSALNLSANGRTKIHYYYDGSNLLSINHMF